MYIKNGMITVAAPILWVYEQQSCKIFNCGKAQIS
jgi:hypothetical protein